METFGADFRREELWRDQRADWRAVAQTREAAKGKSDAGWCCRLRATQVWLRHAVALASWIHRWHRPTPVDDLCCNEARAACFEYIKEKNPDWFSSSTVPPPSGKAAYGRRSIDNALARARTLEAQATSSCLLRTTSSRRRAAVDSRRRYSAAFKGRTRCGVESRESSENGAQQKRGSRSQRGFNELKAACAVENIAC